LKQVYGKNPPSVLSYMPGVSKVQEVEKILQFMRPFSIPSKKIWPWLKIA
jgi:hypothetical protein